MNIDRTFLTLILGIIGGILLVIAAFIQYHDKRSSDIEAAKQKNKADTFQQQLLESQKEFKDLQSQNLNAAINTLQKIETASVKLDDSVNLAKHALDNLTGGGHIPILLITTQPNKPQGHHKYFSVLFQLMNTSNVNFNDIDFSILDSDSAFMNTFTSFKFKPDGALATSFQKREWEDVMENFNAFKTVFIKRLGPSSHENAYATGFPMELSLPGFYNSSSGSTYAIFIKWIGGTIKIYITIDAISDRNTILKECRVIHNEKDVENPLHYVRFFSNDKIL